MSSARISVPTTETTIEPMQPRRLEKNANMVQPRAMTVPLLVGIPGGAGVTDLPRTTWRTSGNWPAAQRPARMALAPPAAALPAFQGIVNALFTCHFRRLRRPYQP
jgi:hypothetical protein